MNLCRGVCPYVSTSTLSSCVATYKLETTGSKQTKENDLSQINPAIYGNIILKTSFFIIRSSFLTEITHIAVTQCEGVEHSY